MDQLGNTEPTIEPGSDDPQPTGSAGDADAPTTPCTLAVYRAVPEPAEADEPPAETDDADGGTQSGSDTSTKTGTKTGNASTDPASTPPTALFDAPIATPEIGHDPAAGPEPGSTSAGPDATDEAAEPGPHDATNGIEGFPDGFTGVLAMANLESFDEQATGEALSRLAHLVRWAQAQQARALNHMEGLFRNGMSPTWGQEGQGIAFSLAAAECAALLNVPQTTAQGMMFEAGRLCSTHTATLTGLEEGRFSYAHAQVVLDQCQDIPETKLAGFEAELLGKAEGVTRAQFCAKARRLREQTYPETIPVRHQTAFDKRKVVLERDEDGMSWLSAHVRAEHAQQIYTALSTSARGEQADGDPRTTDQLRADILSQLLMGGLGSHRVEDAATAGNAPDSDSGKKGPAGVLPRAEIMVLINAETLFGADEQPAELHGYGPISADAARRLARNAVSWTGLAQDPATGQILGVGRRRKVPAGLARWLRARDGTCRFPGCRVSTAVTEIDHTTDWAKGGDTEHGNLEHLCRRHHRFKTLGFWKATQPTPGVIEWTSPAGRVYRTDPFLDLKPAASPSISGRQPTDQQESVPPF